MAGEQVTISVTYGGNEQSIPLVVRPSLELSDEQVDHADSELRRLLRQNFRLPPDSRCFLYEAVSRRSLSAESFRDPNNLPVFPRRWVLTIEPSSQAPLKYAQQPSLRSRDYVNGDNALRDSSPLPSLEDLSLLPHTDHHSSIVLHCGDQGEFGLTLRHFSIRPNIPESNTPDDAYHSDSIGSNVDSVESLCLSTLFVYRLEAGGPAERASLKEGDVILKVNGCSITRCSASEVQAILQRCGRKLTLLVSPKESDDLQFLYPNYAYGKPGEQATLDATVLCCDLVVMVVSGGGGGEGNASCDSSSVEALGSLPSLDDPLQLVDLPASPTNFPSHSRQDSIDVFSDPHIQMAHSPIHFHVSSSPPRVQSENGFVDWSSTLRNLEEMTSTESLNKLAASINPEMSPSWSHYMEENGFSSQIGGHLDDHNNPDQGGTRLDSRVGGGQCLESRGSDPPTTEGATKRSKTLLNDFAEGEGAGHTPKRPSVEGSASAVDSFDVKHTDRAIRSVQSVGERTAQKMSTEKGQSSLGALTRLADDVVTTGSGEGHTEDASRWYTPRGNHVAANVQDPWISRSDSPSKSDESPHSQQSAGCQQGSQEQRSSGGDGGGGGSQNSSDLKSRRTNRSYQSQRAQLHKALGSRQSAEGDHPRSNVALDGHSSTGTKTHVGRRGRPSQSALLPGNPSPLTPEEHKHFQDATMPSFVEDGVDHRTTVSRYHQRVPSNEERHSYVGMQGLPGKPRRPSSARVPLQTSVVAETTHVSIDEAIERASQPNRSLSDAAVSAVNGGLGIRHEPVLVEDPSEESIPRKGGRKLFATQSVDITESASMPTVEGFLKKERDDGHGKRGSHTVKQFYCVMDGSKLMFYKDKKDAAQKKVCDEPPLELTSCSVETSSDYSKKKHMIRVVCTSGPEHVFHMEDEEEMKRWVEAMRKGGEPVEARRRSQPLVPRLSPQGSPVPNRRAVSPTQQPKAAKRRGSEFRSFSEFVCKLWRGRGGGKTEEVDSSASYLAFGQPLEECPASEENKKIPLVVECCIREVERNGLKAEGIYRIPGKVALINSLSADIDKGNYSQLDGGYDDIHTIGSLLKKFLKDLPDPLIPSHLYVDFINAACISNEKDRMKELKKLVFNLPPVHYHTLKFLLTHLHKVSEYSETNKMNINNLCVVFGPTIVRDTGGSNEIQAIQCGYSVIDPLLKHVKEFFHSDMCAEEEREEEEEEAAREAANCRLEPTVGHNLSPKPHNEELEGTSDENLLTVASRRGYRSSEGNIAAVKEVGLSGPWESNSGNVSSMETTGSSFWKQQPKKKKLSRTRLLTPFPPPPTGEAIQELNTPASSNPTHRSLLGIDHTKSHRRSMPAVSVDTVISNRDLVDDVSVGEVPRNHWVEEPSAASVSMYRAQSAVEGSTKKGDPSNEIRSRDRSLSTSVHLTNKISNSESSNSRQLPMESFL